MLLSIAIVLVIFCLIIWLMIKEDESELSKPTSMPVMYDRLSKIEQINLLLEKIEELELENLIPCKSKLNAVADRIKYVTRLLIKPELLYKDELMQYEIAIDWIKSPAEFRNKGEPPKFFPAYSVLTDSDMKRLAELTLEPVDFTRTPVVPSRCSIASGKSSLPVVDEWLENMGRLIIKIFDMGLNIKTKVSSWTYTEDLGLIDFLRRAIVVSAKEHTNGKKTIFTLDCMIPSNVILDHTPEVFATAIPLRPLNGLCCTPIKYTPS